MAPFKLKFRMGSSRSTSQEVDGDPQASQSLLNNSIPGGIGASCSTIDSTDCTSLGSTTNERRSLLPNGSSNHERCGGYLNPGILQCNESSLPDSPPPSYEHVLEENRLASLENSTISNPPSEGCSSRMHTSIEQLSNICTDPNCDIADDSQDDEDQQQQRQQQKQTNSRKESLDSTEYLISTMTTPSSHENLLECTGSCDPLCEGSRQDDSLRDNRGQCYEQNTEQCGEGSTQQDEERTDQEFHHYQSHEGYDLSENDDNYSDREWSASQPLQQQQQQQRQSNQQYQQEPTTEIISNKSSKKIYKAVAKEWGITCKMSDQCRCMECQSHYFDCEFDDNEHQKTDGGLGAGTPMFVNEVLHGTACTIL